MAQVLVQGHWVEADCDGKTVTQVVNDIGADVEHSNGLTLKVDGTVLSRRAHVPADAQCIELIEVAAEEDGSTPEAEPNGQEDT